MISPDVGVYLTVTSIGKVMVVSVLPYSIFTACKYRHSTYQHRLVVGFVFLKALTLFLTNRSNVGLNWQISKTLSGVDVTHITLINIITSMGH